MAPIPALDPAVMLWSHEPGERAGRPLLVLLHGYGADEGDLFALAAHLPSGFALCAVRAPLTPPFPAPGYSWYPIEGLESRDPTHVTAAASALLQWIAAETDASTVGLLGFSQGAAVALQALRLAPERIAFVVNLSGYASLGDLPRDGELATLKPPVFWGRGTHDDVIPAALVAHTIEWLPSHVELSGRVYPGLTHSLSLQELDDVRVFLDKRLAEGPAPAGGGPGRRMTVRIWQTIDGTLDNVVSVQNQSGSPETAIRALRLRERGWEAAARHPDRDGDPDRGGLGWPPIDAMLEIPLSDADVSYLRDIVAEAIPVIQTIIELPTPDASSRRRQEESLDLAQQALAVLDGLTRGAGVGDA